MPRAWTLAALLLLSAPTLAAVAPRTPRDLYGDPLPPGAVVRLGSVRLGGPYWAYAIAFSPDGKKAYSAHETGLLCVWDWASRQRLATWKVRKGLTVKALALSSDGKSLAAGGQGGRVEVRDAGTGAVRQELTVAGGHEVASLSFSPDGKYLLAGGRGVRRWKLADGREQLLARTGEAAIAPPNGDGVLAGVDGALVRLPEAGGAPVRLAGDLPDVVAVGMSAARKALAVTQKGVVCEVGRDGVVRRFSIGMETSRRAVFSPDGRYLAFVGAGLRVYLWDVLTAKPMGQVPVHEGWVTALAFTPDSRRLMWGSSGGRLRVWSVPGLAEVGPRPGHDSFLEAMAFSPDGREIAAGTGHAVRFWDARTGKHLRMVVHGKDNLFDLAWAPDGRHLWLSAGHTVLCLPRAGGALRTLKGHQGLVNHLALTPDGSHVISGSEDNTLRIWAANTGLERFCLPQKRVRNNLRRDREVWAVAASPDGRTVAEGGANWVRLWDVRSGRLVRRLENEGVRGQGFRMAYSPDGGVLAVANNFGEVFLYEPGTGQRILSFAAAKHLVWGVAYSPDVRHLATAVTDEFGTDIRVRLWDLATGDRVAEWRGQSPLAFSPDGTRLASALNDGGVLVWDVRHRHGPGLAPGEAELRWDELASESSAAAYRAVLALGNAPAQGVPVLRRRLASLVAPQAEKVNALVRQLDSDDFQEREKASETLVRLGSSIAPLLRRALAAKPSLEVQRRLEQAMRSIRDEVPSRHRLQAIRAVRALELAGTEAARRVLAELARPASLACLQQEAQQALVRLARRPPRPEADGPAPATALRVLIRTTLGDIEAELDAKRAPKTVANFLRYVEAKHYDGGRFHRTVRADNQPDDKVKIAVIQAGLAPKVKEFAPIALERTSKTGLRHVDGALAMARNGPDTATGEFFICVGAQPELDQGGKRNPDGQGFAAFGRVVRGMEVVRAIHAARTTGQALTPPVDIREVRVLRKR